MLKKQANKQKTHMTPLYCYVYEDLLQFYSKSRLITTAGDYSREKKIFHQDDLLLKNTANISTAMIKEGRKIPNHDFTDLSSFQVLFFS